MSAGKRVIAAVSHTPSCKRCNTGIVRSRARGAAKFWDYQSRQLVKNYRLQTLMMGIKIPETTVSFNQLTWLTARQVSIIIIYLGKIVCMYIYIYIYIQNWPRQCPSGPL
jgi:hypothetical protein